MSEDNRPDYEGIYRATYADFVARGQEIAAKDAELAALRDKIKMLEDDGFRCAKRYEAAEARAKELQTVLDAWANVFGSSQLSHASDNFKAEKKARKAAEAKLAACEAKLKMWDNQFGGAIVTVVKDGVMERMTMREMIDHNVAQTAGGGE